jgi:arylsulfatase A-like enzyme
MPSIINSRLTRAGVVVLAALGAGLAVAGPQPAAADAASASTGRPNVILIQTDDQTARQYNHRLMPKTIRLLGQRGTTFHDYIATTAQCCPSRASLLTGQYAHNDGVFANGGSHGGYPALIDKESVLPVWLQQAGYNTIHVGRFLNGYGKVVEHPTDVAPGWTDWQTLFSGSGHYYDYNLSNNGRRVHFGSKDRDYVTRVLSRKSVHAIRHYSRASAPYFLELDERAPHVANGNRSGPCRIHAPEPDPRDVNRFPHAKLPHPPSYNERHMGDKPRFLRGLPKIGKKDKRGLTEHWRCARDSLLGVDRSVAQIFHTVKRTGELGKTVFMFISDNGQFYGEHRILEGKVLPFEEALHLPLVIRMPARYRGGHSRVDKVGRPAGNIDLAPTILDLADAKPCPPAGDCRTMDGRSLMPLLTRNHDWPKRRALLTEYRINHPGRYSTCDFSGIRTGNVLYVRHYEVVNPGSDHCEPTDQRELYNLKRDPFELRNLCYGGDPSNCPVTAEQSELENRVLQLRTCAGIKGRDQRVGERPFCE